MVQGETISQYPYDFQRDATIEKVQNLERDDDLTREIKVTRFGFKALKRRI
jgi:hypothetical protein